MTVYNIHVQDVTGTLYDIIALAPVCQMGDISCDITELGCIVQAVILIAGGCFYINSICCMNFAVKIDRSLCLNNVSQRILNRYVKVFIHIPADIGVLGSRRDFYIPLAGAAISVNPRSRVRRHRRLAYIPEILRVSEGTCRAISHCSKDNISVSCLCRRKAAVSKPCSCFLLIRKIYKI